MANIIAGASQANTPSILTTGGDVLSANTSRRGFYIQNLDTDPLFVRLGTGASSTVFHAVLKGGTAPDDGLGGSFSMMEGVVFQGVVSATGTTPRFVVLEL